MRVVFADTVYWIALTNTRDRLHRRAGHIADEIGAHRVVTSELVLTELLNVVAEQGTYFRRRVVSLVQQARSDPDVEVVPMNSELFHDALSLYRDRPDKGWSLTDCASFLIMERRQITEALTYDRHFEQFGVRALLRN